jgi:hypothetical protein
MPSVMPLPPALVAEVAALYPTATNAELALAFKLEARQVQHIGARHGLRKTAEARSRARLERVATTNADGGLRERLLAAIVAAGAAGLSLDEATARHPGALASQVRAALYKLTNQREIHRAGTVGRSRWFATACHAAAHVASAKPLAQPSAPAAPAAPLAARAGARASVTITPNRAPAHLPGPPVVDARTRITTAPPVPGPEGRWHTNAASVFRALKPGQYHDEPSTWVQAITRSTQP